MARSKDGKSIYLPNLFRESIDLNFCGAGDAGTTGRGQGQAFIATAATIGDKIVTWSFADWVDIAGGVVLFSGALIGDWMTFEVNAPATIVSANSGSNGNANKVPTGLGFNVIIPAAGNGAWDVAGTDMVPVPAKLEDGYWDWDEPDEGKGTVSASPNPGEAKFNLYDVELPLTRWVTKMPIIGSGMIDFKVSAIQPKQVLPHWPCKVILHNVDGAHTVDAGWHLFTGRKKTT